MKLSRLKRVVPLESGAPQSAGWCVVAHAPSAPRRENDPAGLRRLRWNL